MPGTDAAIRDGIRKVGRAHLILAYLCFLCAATLALLVKALQLWISAGSTGLQSLYFLFLTMHGFLMMHLFAEPALHAGYGLLLIRHLNGSGRMLLVRLPGTSFLVHLLGGMAALIGVLLLGPRSGWMVPAPDLLQLKSAGGLLWMTGLLMLLLARILRSFFYVALLTGKGSSPTRWSAFETALFFTSAAQLLWIPLALAAPALAAAGHAVRWDELYSEMNRPSVYFLSAVGLALLAHIAGTQQRGKIFFERVIKLSVAGTGFLAFARILLRAYVAFAAVPSSLASGVSELLMGALALPLLLASAALAAHAWKTSGPRDSRFALTQLAAILTGIGALSGLNLLSPSGAGSRTSYFLVAHFHSILFGTNVLAFVAGLSSGELSPAAGREFRGNRLALLIGGGTLLAFLPKFLMGALGVMRHQTRLEGSAVVLASLSMAGACLLYVVMAILFPVVIRASSRIS